MYPYFASARSSLRAAGLGVTFAYDTDVRLKN
jgi:hypothetical protein